VAGADHPPPLGVGISVVVDPQGVEIAGVGVTTDVAVGFVDRASIERVRRLNPASPSAASASCHAARCRTDPPSSPGNVRRGRRRSEASVMTSTRLQAANRTRLV
jgi:hypothetical protein